jgi:hypothetical protein
VGPEQGFGVEEVTSLLRRPAAHAHNPAPDDDDGGEEREADGGGEEAAAEDAAEREERRRRALKVSDSDRA